MGKVKCISVFRLSFELLFGTGSEILFGCVVETNRNSKTFTIYIINNKK
jgi:hypothetical protein